MSATRPPAPLLLVLSLSLVLLLHLQPSHSSLVGVILTSRHGTRAPNQATSLLCPANSANLARYLSLDISLEGVTGRGMHQLLQLGDYTREVYVQSGFLKPYYSNEEMYIRAVGEDRTLQSAVAWGHGLYPAGHSPIGYRSDLPSPLPVYTLPDEIDVLLENRKAGCHQRLKVDVQTYDDTRGADMRHRYAALLTHLEALCGVNLSRAIDGSGDNYGDAVKDITDNWTFDFIEHFPPVKGLSLDLLLRFRAYAVEQLIGRILGTPEQVTYLNGDLPLTMLRSFKALIQHREQGSDRVQGVKPLKFIAYHGHREMMYALAAFFDIRYNITYPALPLGAIPPATSLFFELHSVDHPHASAHHTHNAGKGKGRMGDAAAEEDEEWGEGYEVRAVLWSPCDSDDTPDAHLLISLTTADASADLALASLNATHPNRTRASLHRNATLPAGPTGHHTKGGNHGRAVGEVSGHPSGSPSAEARVEKQCGARPIAISACEGGVCSFSEFRRLIHAQIHATGDWRTLCAYDQRTGKERYDNSNRSDSKVPGAGRTQGDHSKSHQEDQPEEEEVEGETVSQTSTGGVEADEGEGSGWGGWMALVWALLAAAVIGGVGYWWFFVRGQPDRAEYHQVPNRV